MLYSNTNCPSPKKGTQPMTPGTSYYLKQQLRPEKKLFIPSGSQQSLQIPSSLEKQSNLSSTETPDRTFSFQPNRYFQCLTRTKSDTSNLEVFAMNSPPKVIASKKCQTTRKEECELGGKIVKTEENDPLQAQSLLSSLDLELHEQDQPRVHDLSVDANEASKLKNIKTLKTFDSKALNALQLKILERLMTQPLDVITKHCKLQILVTIEQQEFEFAVNIAHLPFHLQIDSLMHLLIRLFQEQYNPYHFKNPCLSMLVGKLKRSRIDNSLKLFELFNMTLNGIIELIILEDRPLK